MMFANDDRIARHAKGHYFPVSVVEALDLMRHLGFAASPSRRRLDIRFSNSAPNAYGIHIAAFYPQEQITVYSLPDELDRVTAKVLIERALHEFVRLGKDAARADWRKPMVSLRAYFEAPASLTITRRNRRETAGKPRADAKFSHAFKPKRVKTNERVVHSLELD